MPSVKVNFDELWEAFEFVSGSAFMEHHAYLARDTGLVFWRRADFVALGGYDENRLLAEDIDILWRLRRLGRTRGQRLVRLRGVRTVTSARKFDKHGDWHYLTLMPAVGWKLLREHRTADACARQSWYEDR